MENNFDISISSKRKSLNIVDDSWLIVHESWSTRTLEKSTFVVSLVLLWLSYIPLELIHGSFGDNSKVMWRYTLLPSTSSFPNEACLPAPRSFFMR